MATFFFFSGRLFALLYSQNQGKCKTKMHESVDVQALAAV